MGNIKIYDKRAIISYDVGRVCKFSCSYCYNREELIIPQIADLSGLEGYLRSNANSFDIITSGCEQELFVDPIKAIEFLNYFSDFDKILSFSTKESLTEDIIKDLVKIDRKLKSNNQYLLVEVSFSSGHSIPHVEKGVPSVDSRIITLETLINKGIYSVPFIRPILPDELVDIEDIYRLIDRTKDFCKCYALGDFYFNETIAGNLGLHSLGHSFWDLVDKSASADFLDTEEQIIWSKYVNKEKKDKVKEYVESYTRSCYDSSTETILHFSNNKSL